MFSIDINLLRDRPGFGKEEVSRGGVAAGPVDNTPIILGGVVAAAAVGLVLLGSALLTFRNQQLAEQERNLDDQLAKIAPQLSELDKLKAEEQRINTETQALATVFNQIKPWSATLQDIRDRVPPTLQIAKIEQAAPAPPPAPAPAAAPADGAAPAPAPAAAPAPPPDGSTALTLTGKARSFSDINDFVLILQQSPFLKSDSTKLVRSQRAPEDAKGPSLIDYTITTATTTTPASALLPELSKNGAAGLVSRINFLKQKGVIKQ
ncbi:MAG: PilN domain-containing protein [Aphanocapsa sp. GSE-SYN-MK-11-07L]|jgi:type IV pilus assembly protein PilN|nr:PilN domain-containing protein [Aphanocapsa sp. GSE-SYN-MK-11-07L]